MTSKEAKLNKDNNMAERALNTESKKYLLDIICYLRTQNVDTYEIEVIRGDIISMFQEAQTRGDSITKVLGSDYKTFCDEILQDAKHKKKRKVFFEWADSFISALLVLVGITFLFSDACWKMFTHLFKKADYNWLWGITTGNIITWVVLLVAVFILFSVTANFSVSSKNNRHTVTANFIFGAGIMVAFLVMAYITKIYFNQVIFQVNIGALGIALVIGYIFHRVLKRCS